MAENQAIPTDEITLEDARGELVASKTPLGLEGMTGKAEQAASTGDREKAQELSSKVGFMAEYSKYLMSAWIWDKPQLSVEKEKLERQLNAQAKLGTGKSFLMDLADPDLAAQPLKVKGQPNSDNITQLALAHSVVAEALAGDPQKTVATGRLTRDLELLRDNLKTYAAGGEYKNRQVEVPDVPVQKTAAKSSEATEKVTGGNKVDEALGRLETQEELDLVKEIQAALGSKTAIGFLHNRKEAWGKAKIAHEGFGNRSLINIEEATADKIYYKLTDNFPIPTYGAESIKSGDSQLRLVTNFDSLRENPMSQDKKAPVKIGKDKSVLALDYYVLAQDKSGRNGVFHMYLAVPQPLGAKIYAYCEKHADDSPTCAVKILGHALSEDLDINYQDEQKQDRFAKLAVNKVRFVRT